MNVLSKLSQTKIKISYHILRDSDRLIAHYFKLIQSSLMIFYINESLRKRWEKAYQSKLSIFCHCHDLSFICYDIVLPNLENNVQVIL
jgi:hypothetical protein